MSNEVANKFSDTQISQNELVIRAFYRAFGYDVVNGKIVPMQGVSQKELPKFTTKQVRVKEANFFSKQFISTASIAKYFDTDLTGGKVNVKGNLRTANLTDGKVFVITGIKCLQAIDAVQAANDDPNTLDFGSVVTNAIENGRVDFIVNKEKVFENEQISHLFRNGDAIPNYFRLPALEVVEPNSSFQIEATFDVAPAKWVEFVVCGFIVEPA